MMDLIHQLFVRFMLYTVFLFSSAIFHSVAVGSLCSKWPGGGTQES